MNIISWFTYKWSFSLAMLVYQRVYLQSLCPCTLWPCLRQNLVPLHTVAIGGHSQGLKRWGKAVNQWGWVKPFWKTHRLIKHPLNIHIGWTLHIKIHLVCLCFWLNPILSAAMICRMFRSIHINHHSQTRFLEQTRPNLWPLAEQERTLPRLHSTFGWKMWSFN